MTLLESSTAARRVALARQRTLRRRGEAGAVMFVVSMMVTVLAAVGMFALAASATEVRAAGNERQSAQTHYLAGYGILAFAREAEQGKVQSYVSLMKSNPDVCLSLPLPSVTYMVSGNESALAKACYRISGPEFQKIGAWSTAPSTAYAGTQPYYPTTAAPGSLGPVLINPGFFVEVTDVSSRNAPGYSTGSCSFAVVTGTSFGVTQPMVGTTVAYGAEGQEMQRARFVAGPMCPPPQ
jgi:hypothetical protein